MAVRPIHFDGHHIFGGRSKHYFRPCIAMNAAQVRAEAAITTRSGLTVDLADFAIASQPMLPSKAVTELVKVNPAKTGNGST